MASRLDIAASQALWECGYQEQDSSGSEPSQPPEWSGERWSQDKDAEGDGKEGFWEILWVSPRGCLDQSDLTVLDQGSVDQNLVESLFIFKDN